MPTMDAKSAMENIRAVARKSGLTQQAIGERMGYPRPSARKSVSQFFKSRNPTLSVVARFAEAMGVTVESLLERGAESAE